MSNQDHRTTYNVLRAKAGTHRFDPVESVVLDYRAGSVAAAQAWLENNEVESNARLLILPDDGKIARGFLFVVGNDLPPVPRRRPVRADTDAGF